MSANRQNHNEFSDHTTQITLACMLLSAPYVACCHAVRQQPLCLDIMRQICLLRKAAGEDKVDMSGVEHTLSASCRSLMRCFCSFESAAILASAASLSSLVRLRYRATSCLCRCTKSSAQMAEEGQKSGQRLQGEHALQQHGMHR